MGKKTTATSKKSSAGQKDPAAPAKRKRTAEASADEKTPLAKKAVKAVAAVALGVGSAIAAKRTKRKTPPKAATDRSSAESLIASPPPRKPTHEEIAFRAYFLSEERRAAGRPADPHQDWIDAERELLGSSTRQSA